MKREGFTLVELLAVIAILAILVIIALPNVLKLYNNAKKNAFLTEVKTIYNNAGNKYISESLNGRIIKYTSSFDNTKLDMTGNELQYCVVLNDDGTVKNMKVSNGKWIATLKDGEKITDLKSDSLVEGNLNDSICSVSFAYDSWETISKVVKSGQTDNYYVGDTKTVDLGDYGTHTVRIANMKTHDECNSDNFSQSSCGFVVEFADIIAMKSMNPKGTYKDKNYRDGWNLDGWPASKMYKFLNDETDENSIINALPTELKAVIIDTKTISGHGNTAGENNFKSTDKLFLLATQEVWENGTTNKIENDSARSVTKQLEYYANNNVTTDENYDFAVKKNSKGEATSWWLRSARNTSDRAFYRVRRNGNWLAIDAKQSNGVSPAFRVGK